MRTKIIYEDNYIIVAHKPAGLATQTAKVGQPDMVSELKNYLAGTATKGASTSKTKQIYLGVIHRLDQPVEGLLIFAKEKSTAAALTSQLGQGTLNKQYYAAICGQPVSERGELVDYLVKEDSRAYVVDAKKAEQVTENVADKLSDAKRAVLQYKMIAQISVNTTPAQTTSAQSTAEPTGDFVALMDIHIDTGRFHQIRVQMAHAGMPLLGDTKYGSEESVAMSKSLGVRSVALCAYQLDFVHPKIKKKMSFQTKPEGTIFAKFDL